MGLRTKIEWCDSTWNPWIGCSHVHAGCDHCYAEAQAGRHGVEWGPDGTRRKTSEAYWRKPLAWDKAAGVQGVRRRVFCGSLCDVFEDWGGPITGATGRRLWKARAGHCDFGYCEDTDEQDWAYGKQPVTMADLRRDAFRLIDRTRYLDWLIATKRPENIVRFWGGNAPRSRPVAIDGGVFVDVYRSNVWLLYSASDQATLDAGLPHLFACRDLVPVLGLSLEPLVGPVDLRAIFRTRPCDDPTCDHQIRGCHNQIRDKAAIDWVIVGGESGPGARPCNIDWIRSIVRQCASAGVACFVKQLGARPVDLGTGLDWPEGVAMQHDPDYGNGARIVLRDPKGGDFAEWPEDVRVRQVPHVPRACRVCGCTDADCRGCFERTGEPCYWIEDDLCSACAGQ